ncbi:MAG: tetratricopeptide repeat protein [Cytophagales bacterium]
MHNLKYIFSAAIISIVLNNSIFAQKAKKEADNVQIPSTATNDNSYSLEEKILKDALKYGDLNVAKQSLYKMIALKPENKNLKDSLAFVYINLGSLQQAILLSREILETTPDNVSILEVKAIAEQNLGLAKEALTSYESLHSKSKNVYHLYQIATLQYDLKRLAECNASIDAILTSPEVEKKELNIGTGTRGEQQKVVLKAAALNMKGVLAMDLNENTIAKVCFDEALKLTPDFVLAKNNATFLTNKLKTNASETKKPMSKPNQNSNK